MPLFEVAIMEVPTPKDMESGAEEKLVFGPKYIVARDSQSAAMSAVMDNAAVLAGINRSRMQVLTRPFA